MTEKEYKSLINSELTVYKTDMYKELYYSIAIQEITDKLGSQLFLTYGLLYIPDDYKFYKMCKKNDIGIAKDSWNDIEFIETDNGKYCLLTYMTAQKDIYSAIKELDIVENTIKLRVNIINSDYR